MRRCGPPRRLVLVVAHWCSRRAARRGGGGKRRSHVPVIHFGTRLAVERRTLRGAVVTFVRALSSLSRLPIVVATTVRVHTLRHGRVLTLVHARPPPRKKVPVRIVRARRRGRGRRDAEGACGDERECAFLPQCQEMD